MRNQVARNEVTWQKSRNLRKLLLNVMEDAGEPQSLGERIAQARRDAGLTQDQLADLIGVKMRQVQNYEAGDSDPYRKISQIAAATAVSVEWLRRGGPREEPAGVGEELRRLQGEVREIRALLEERLPPAEDDPVADTPG